MNNRVVILSLASFFSLLSLLSLWLVLALLDDLIAMLLGLTLLFPIWFATLLFLNGKTNGTTMPIGILAYFLILDGMLVRLWGEFSLESGYGMMILGSIITSLLCAALLFRKDVRDAMLSPGEEGEPIEAVQ
jgi:hypothetical protein